MQKAITEASNKPSIRDLTPRANYVIRPAAGSLVGIVPSLQDDKDRANAVVKRMLAASGARRRRGKQQP